MAALSGRGLFWIASLVALFAFGVFALPRLEGEAPRLRGPESVAIGAGGGEIELEALDDGSGLRSLQVRIVSGGGGQTVFEESYPGHLLGGAADTGPRRIAIPLDARALSLADGTATLIATARDWLWRDAASGNRSEVSIRLDVDTRPPRVQTTTGLTYVYRGGAGAATYHVDEDTRRDGVRVGDRFYPGHPAPGSAPGAGHRVAFFAVEVHAPRNPKIHLEAEDAAGNLATAPLDVRVNERRFSEERLNLSRRFFENVIPALAEHTGVSKPTPVEAFQVINEEVRARDEARIRELIAGGDAERHWHEPFVQLPNSKVMSRFAEQRRYFAADREISQATHYGFDLASLATAPVIAANRGRVIFADDLGIYGNCVLIDHGMGITTLYGHLTDFAVEAGAIVERGATLGRTGATGLAGGDHLHFAVLVGDTYVDPLEWWDARWIESHVEVKLASRGR